MNSLLILTVAPSTPMLRSGWAKKLVWTEPGYQSGQTTMDTGKSTTVVNTSELKPGTCFIRIQAGTEIKVLKMTWE